jgi:hypothetical protein
MPKKRLEASLHYKIGFDGPNVQLLIEAAEVQILGKMPPAQAREIAFALNQTADMVEQWEGVSGGARRDVKVFPQVQHLLGAERG